MGSKTIELSEVITDIAAGPFGSNLKVSCFVPEGFPIIDGANLKGLKVTDNLTKFVTEEKARSLSRSIAKRGEVVVTISGTLGQIAYIPEDSLYPEYLCSQRQFRVAFDTAKVYVPYLVYYFHTREGQAKILSFANQTGVPALAQPTKNFKKIIVELPEIEEQRKIAKSAELLTEKIELNNRLNDYLAELTSLLFDQAVQDCTEAVPLGSYVSISSGKRPPVKSSCLTETCDVPLFGASSQMGYTSEYLTDEKLLVIGRVGTHGIVQRIDGKAWPSDNTLVIRSDHYETAFQLLQRVDYSSLNRGSTQPLITQGDLKAYEVPAVEPTLLEQFEAQATQLMTLYDHNNLESIQLSQLRDALLPRLMSGEIDVSKVVI